MSERTARQRSFIERIRKTIDQRWNEPGVVRAYDEEDRLTLREIDYGIELASQWVFSNKVGISPEMRVDTFVYAHCPGGWYSDPDKRESEIESLRARVRELERLIHEGGPGEGHR